MRRRVTSQIALCVVWCLCVANLGLATTSSKTPSPVATARAQISRGELDNAEATLWTVLSSNQNDSEALTLLAIVRGRQQRYGEAEALLRKSLQIDPQSLVAHRNLASALIAQNRPDSAIPEYKEVIRLSPNDASAKVELARLYLAGGKFADSLSLLETIPAQRLPLDAVPAEAASLLGVGRKQEAAALIPRVNGSTKLSSELAEVFLEGNAPELALRTVNMALAASAHAPASLYDLKGRALQLMGNGPGASSALREALARDPKSVPTLLAMAAMRASEGKHAESLNFVQRAYALKPESVEVLRPLVIESTEAGERKMALRAAHALAEKSPDNLEDLYLAGAAMLEGREFDEAASLLRKYVAQRPSDSRGQLGLGIAESAQQHYPEARKALEQALQLDPKLADAEYQLGMMADQQGATVEALQHYERAVQIQPQHAKALASLGGHYLQSGELDKAQPLLSRSLAADPNNYKAEYDLALVLAKLGQTSEAKLHMERSQQLKVADDAGKKSSEIKR